MDQGILLMGGYRCGRKPLRLHTKKTEYAQPPVGSVVDAQMLLTLHNNVIARS